jgi:MFS family permease
MKERLNRNILLYYVTRALHLPVFWLPILYFYLTQVKGLSVIETTFLMGLQEFVLIFLELPTGVIADKISRRFSITLGYLIMSLPLIFLPFTDSFAMMIVIFIVKSVGKALISGADSALLYDTLLDLDKTTQYKKIKIGSSAWAMGVAAVCITLGGWMGEIKLYNLTFYLAFLLQLVAALAAYLMFEPEISRKAQTIQDSNYLTHTWTAIKIITKSSWILVLAIMFALLEGTAVNMKWYYPALFENLGYGLLATGLLIGVLYGGKTLIYLIGTKLAAKEAIQNTIMWTLIISVSWIGILTIGNVVALTIFLILIWLGIELAINSTEELIHESLESRVRATAMSFVNLLSSIGATALLWSWGATVQLANIETAVGTQALIFGIAGITFLTYYKQKRSTVV